MVRYLAGVEVAVETRAEREQAEVAAQQAVVEEVRLEKEKGFIGMIICGQRTQSTSS